MTAWLRLALVSFGIGLVGFAATREHVDPKADHLSIVAEQKLRTGGIDLADIIVNDLAGARAALARIRLIDPGLRSAPVLGINARLR